MPAIDPQRLRRQSARLARVFSDPEAFVGQVHELLSFYADRTHRPGETGTPPPLIHSYRVPAPVLRQILRDLSGPSKENPEIALLLADTLWLEENLECRLIAIHLLSWMPNSLELEIRERMIAWADPGEEGILLDLLLSDGIQSYRRESESRLLRQIRAWLTEPDFSTQSLGLRALKPFAADPAYKNLPQIFAILRSPTQIAPRELRPYLQDLLEILADRSPNETAFFLRECLLGASGRGTAALLRGVMDRFPPDLQASLRAATREKERGA